MAALDQIAAEHPHIAALLDRDRDGVEDTGVATWAIAKASREIEALAVALRPEYKNDTDLAAETYDTTADPCPMLRDLAAELAFDHLRADYRKNGDTVPPTHPSLVMAAMIGRGEANLVKK
jgi:hypothetical protein